MSSAPDPAQALDWALFVTSLCLEQSQTVPSQALGCTKQLICLATNVLPFRQGCLACGVQWRFRPPRLRP